MNDFASRARLGYPKVAAIAPFCAAPSWADYPGIVVQMLGDVHAALCCAVTELDAVAGRNPLFRRRLDLALDVRSESRPTGASSAFYSSIDSGAPCGPSGREIIKSTSASVNPAHPCVPSRRSYRSTRRPLESKFDVELAVVLGGVEGRHALVAGGADFVDSAQTFDL